MAIARLYEERWAENTMTNENHLAQALLIKPEVIGPAMTFLTGREDQYFPLSFLTEGMGNVEEIEGYEYEYPIVGRLDKSVPLGTAITTGTPGIGFTTFDMEFNEKHFARDYSIVSPSGKQLRITQEPVQKGSKWVYTVQLLTDSASDFMPLTDLTENTYFSRGFAAVAMYGSRGNNTNWVAPAKVRGQITALRKSMRYQGTAAFRTMTIEIPGVGKMWWDWYEYQANLQFKRECEHLYWYAQDNRDANGIIHQKDWNGAPVPVGDGILNQIQNKDSYGTLTANKIKNTVRDVLFGMADSRERTITLYTGTGGLESFDVAMKAELGSSSWIKVSDAQFVTGTGNNLSLGGYFTQYRHIDGHIINVKYLPLFDVGPVAEAQRASGLVNPKSGLPYESYRMIYLDMSNYDGQPNVRMITQKGRSMLRWAVAGGSIPPGFTGNALRASEIDGADIHMMKVGGVVLRRYNTSIDLQYVAQ